jgi:hypothetical protein
MSARSARWLAQYLQKRVHRNHTRSVSKEENWKTGGTGTISWNRWLKWINKLNCRGSFCGMKVGIKCSSLVCSDCGTTRGWVVIHPYSLHLTQQPRHTSHLNFLLKASKICIYFWCVCICVCMCVRACVRARVCAKLQHNSSRTNKNLLNGHFDGGMLLKLNFLFAKVGIPVKYPTQYSMHNSSWIKYILGT